MGLHQDNKPLGQYLSVSYGSIVLKSDKPDEGFETITLIDKETQEPFEKYIKRFASLDGRIKDIEWYDRDWNKKRFMGMKIHVKDGGEHFYLDLMYGTRPFNAFMHLMDSIDYDKTVEFVAFKDRASDNTVFLVKQDGAVIQWNYTKNDPGDCPPATKNRLGKWNFDDQEEWLHDRLMNHVIPTVKSLNEFDEPEREYTGTQEDADTIAERAAIESEKAFNPPRRNALNDPRNPLNQGPDETQDMPDYVKNSMEAQ